MPFEIISRQAAHERGDARYYTGRPCKYNHDAQRFVASGACVLCIRGYSRQYAREKNGASCSVTFTGLHADDAAVLRETYAALQASRDAASAANPFDAAKARARVHGPDADLIVPNRMTPR